MAARPRQFALDDQLVSVEIDVPASDAELQKFAEEWKGGGNPRASLGV